jgi:murein DD-endopeptidase MepM/ murein hydrolase activator NlpD
MKIIFLSDFCKRTGSIDVCLPRAAAIAGLSLAGLVAVAVWSGFLFGKHFGAESSVDESTAELHEMLQSERRMIAEAKAEQRAHLDALALKIAELQAHLMRLDALGGRLVELGELDEAEFDFASAPPLGGLEEALPDANVSAEELSTDMARISTLLSDREDKLAALEQLLMSRELLAEVIPSGRPVKKGWMSSAYGRRTDPFTGKKSFHRGLDFAGKRGTEVIAVASGVVTRSEKASGYGNVVEIRHGDGYSTLYGHNDKNLVKAGDVVTKGQAIALLGNTGRSSGPHVHFEVHRNGKHVNPRRFVR